MTVQEIFKLPQIKTIEEEIIRIESGFREHIDNDSEKVAVIKELLRVRKELLNQQFIMNADYAKLLAEFNEALRLQLIELKNQMVRAYDAVKASGINGEIESRGECWLGYRYSQIHPVQTIRAKKIWEILNGTRDKYVDMYDEGVFGIDGIYRGTEYDRKHLFDGLEPDGFNHNHYLEGEFTDNMHIILPTHFLYDDMSFSLFDLLWVRDFTSRVHVEVDNWSYKNSRNDVDDDDLDWDELDYMDD